jgi:hypothetical protein
VGGELVVVVGAFDVEVGDRHTRRSIPVGRKTSPERVRRGGERSV